MNWDQPTNTATHFETCLEPFPNPSSIPNIPSAAYATHAGADPGNPTYSYVDFSVNAPAGTKSLLISFGSYYWDDYDLSFAGGALIGEVQAFATPEPSVLTLLGTGLCGLLCYAWRKRR